MDALLLSEHGKEQQQRMSLGWLMPGHCSASLSEWAYQLFTRLKGSVGLPAGLPPAPLRAC